MTKVSGTPPLTNTGHLASAPEHLMVFVHGVNTSHLTTWKHLPDWLQDTLQVPIEQYIFDYPSRPWHETSIESAANKLAQDVQSGFPNARNIIFVAHSTGGLVIKKMLLDRRDSAMHALGKLAFESRAIPSLWHKTRLILNFDVPHHGGDQWLTSWTSHLHSWWRLAFRCIGPAVRVYNLLGRGPNWGTNQIIDELRSRRDLEILEQRYLSAVAEFRRRRLPTPLSRELIARIRGVIDSTEGLTPHTDEGGFEALTDTSGRILYQLPGNHSDLKWPTSRGDRCMKVCTQLLAKYQRPLDTVLAEKTLSRLLFNDRRRVDVLAGEGRMGDKPQTSSRTTTDSQIPQRAALENSLSLLKDGVTPVVLTGAPGVGKTTVIRMAARTLCLSFLQALQSHRPLPILFLLQDFSIKELQEGSSTRPLRAESIWHFLLDTWAARVSRFLPMHTDRIRHLVQNRMEKYPTYLIIDGVDEFLQLHPRVTLGHLRSALDLHQSKDTVRALVAIRFSYQNIDRLVKPGGACLTLGELTEREASQLFPDIWQDPGIAQDPTARRFLANPLFASALAAQPNLIRGSHFRSRAALFTFVLDTIVSKSQVPDDRWPISAWNVALMMLARVLFARFRPSLERRELQSAALDLVQRWSEYFESSHHSTRPLFDDLRKAREILSDGSGFDRILNRTVFEPTLDDRWKIYHLELRDYLVAQYLAWCIRTGFVADLQERAHTAEIFHLAGELLNDIRITPQLVASIARQTIQCQNWFIFGNFGAVVGNASMDIEGPAVNELLSSLSTAEVQHFPTSKVAQLLKETPSYMDPTIRHIMLSNWGFRALRQHNDASAASLRRGLTEILPAYLGASRYGNVVTRSLAWCYLQEFHEEFKTPVPSALPEDEVLSARDEHVQQGAAVVASPAEDRDLHYRSFQVGFLRVVRSVSNEQRRVIMAVHYLYCLASAHRRRQDLLGSETEDVLNWALDEESTFAKAVEDAKGARNAVSRVYGVCREVWRS